MLLVFLRVALIDRRHQVLQLVLVLILDLRQSQHRSGLLVNDCAQTSFALHDRVGDAHLAAERGQEDDEFDRVDVVCDQDEGGFLVLDEPDDVIQAVLDVVWFLADVFLFLAFGDSGRFLLQPVVLLLFGLGAVFVEESEGLRGGVAVEGVLELRDGGWDFEAEVQDLLLALEADVFWPFYHSFGLVRRKDVRVRGVVIRERLREGCTS